MADSVTVETIAAGNGVVLRVTVQTTNQIVEVSVRKEAGPACVLHWGAVPVGGGTWQRPPQAAWPSGSTPSVQAVDTPLGDGLVAIRLQSAWRFGSLDFVLFDPKTSRWESNQGRNYRIVLPSRPRVRAPAVAAQALAGGEAAATSMTLHALDDGYELAVAIRSSESSVTLALATDVQGPLFLYWGVASNRREWLLPSKDLWPPGTRQAAETAVETPFKGDRDDPELRTLRIDLPAAKASPALTFVLRQSEADKWWKDRGRDFYVDLAAHSTRNLMDDPALTKLADEIVEHETSRSSWTLMHRFNLAWDLLDRVPNDDVTGLALLFVWLRFSAIRQLDWQRHYNTQPRELAHAQDRLTLKLAERFARSDEKARPVVRMLATTLGRGGDGQRVRDGILEIMHRHHLKEVAGHFLEEWHQKLHNNTTPDDVVVCEAYLEFLRSNGDPSVFYKVCEAAGVSRERLLGFDRPIRSQPDFIPHLRDALVHDFGEFLGVLRKVHSASDLGTSLQAAREFLDEPTRQLLDGIWHGRDDRQARGWLFQSITQAREILTAQLDKPRAGLRELLYLDLALEDSLRNLVERNLHESLSFDELLDWTTLALRNLVCVRKSEEFTLSLRHLKRLLTLPRSGHEWSLHAQAVLERIRRELVRITDADAHLIQPLAEYLGTAFGAAKWTLELFSEEVLRGRFELAASALMLKLDEVLRQIAKLGHWQVVSRGTGRVEGMAQTCGSLSEIQGKSFDVSTILVAERISGEEDIPAGVVAVLTESPLDLMAHIAVRARNARILLATGWDAARLAGLRETQGQWIRLSVTAEGDIVTEAGQPSAQLSPRPIRVLPSVIVRRTASEYATPEHAFDANNVGAKSRNLKALRGRLPDWIHVPAGIALPYGVCERVLDDSSNRSPANRHHELVAELRGADGKSSSILSELRRLTLQLEAPPELVAELRKVMVEAKFAWPTSFADAWMCIKQVWASKWNDRAYLSRRSMGFADESLAMAVLVQQVVPADYAFVLHTANPITGDRDDLVGEVVLGLGETLVGNHPGRAFGFRHQRSTGTTHITSFPSKTLGLFGQGLIFRSDTSAEDLAGFAGAGLYDSVMLPQARQVVLDYENEDLLWNEDLRKRVVEGMTEVGLAVEKVFGTPQDIEGAYANGRFFVLQARPQVGLDDD
jgi:alpha-glucan,water dikinase